MDRLIIEGVPPYDGEYDFELIRLSNGELHRIKRLTGIVAGQIGEALINGDTDLAVGIGIVVSERKHGSVDEDTFWKSPFGSCRIELGVDERPPAEAQEAEVAKPRSENGSSGRTGDEPSEKAPSIETVSPQAPEPTGHPV